ncbi:MAG: hypothetical protein DRO15_07875 [Thermoprotei archaeon]|nr:MAG: hypothetical protein DRO15_07875 [Thermoprotei archaeon]
MVPLNNFEKTWGGGQTIGEKIKEVFKRKEPLRHKLVISHYKIKTMVSRLEVFLERLKGRDRSLFERVVNALTMKDKTRAAMYANEIAEIRKLVRQLTFTQVALEQVSLRIETALIFGDVMNNLIPVLGVVKELGKVLRGIMPELSLELREVEENLREIVIEAGEAIPGVGGEIYTSPEARKILEEAQVIAEQRMKEKFPELPAISAGVAEETSSATS